MFDLQLFDEEVAENSAETQNAENSQAELPEGFEGLEEFKDEILEEISQNEQAQEVPEEKISEETEQYQSKDDEIAALKAQIDELKKQGEKSQPKEETPKISTPQAPKFQRTQTPPPQMQVTPEFMKAFNQATDALAMKWTGMSAQDVQDLEFAEEGDEDLARWKFAKQQAAIQVRADIQAAQLRMQQEQQIRNDSIKGYQEFLEREKAESDFQNVLVYASGTLFTSLPEYTQKTLAQCFAKVENGQATPAEMMCVQNYFLQAKELYRKQKSKPKNNQSWIEKIIFMILHFIINWFLS